MSDRRFLPGEVLTAYASTGRKPVLNSWFLMGVPRVCPAMALYLQTKQDRKPCGSTRSDVIHEVRDWLDLVVGARYAEGFINATDLEKMTRPTSERYQQGYADGLVVRDAIIKSGMLGDDQNACIIDEISAELMARAYAEATVAAQLAVSRVLEDGLSSRFDAR